MKGVQGKNINANQALYESGRRKQLSAAEACLLANDKQKRRFWSCVIKTGKCWLYSPAGARGYGRFNVNFHSIHAHRAAKIWAANKLPPHEDSLACHLCRNRHCVRPSHIVWGDAKKNIGDKKRDGTNKPWSHCGQRHPKAKITDAQAKTIFKEYKKGGVSMQSFADQYGVCRKAICNLIHGKSWADVIDEKRIKTTDPRKKGYMRGENHKRAKMTLLQAETAKKEMLNGATRTATARKYGVSRAAMYFLAKGINWKV